MTPFESPEKSPNTTEVDEELENIMRGMFRELEFPPQPKVVEEVITDWRKAGYVAGVYTAHSYFINYRDGGVSLERI